MTYREFAARMDAVAAAAEVAASQDEFDRLVDTYTAALLAGEAETMGADPERGPTPASPSK